MSDETKAWWQSRTIIGIVVMLLAQVLKWFQVDIVNEELTDIVTILLEFVGAGLAVYGRVKARKTIRRTRPGGMFNPNAEVRKAKPTRKKMLGIFLLFLSMQCHAITYPSHVWYENPIKVHPIVDDRPFLIRLLDSLIFSISVLPFKGEVKGNADF
jgi:uncharacterized membrane protein